MTLETPLEFIDVHCHVLSKQTHRQILNLDVQNLPSGKPPDSPYSLGIHPWQLPTIQVAQALAQIASHLPNPHLLAIGECGLDKTIATPLSEQIEVFKRQIALSETVQKPLIIHCVKAFNELLALKKDYNPKQTWLIHGFNNHPALARQLIQANCYLSLGKALLNPQSNAAKVLADLPLHWLFLETDAAENTSISAIYSAAAKIVGLSIPALQAEIISNFTRVFLND